MHQGYFVPSLIYFPERNTVLYGNAFNFQQTVRFIDDLKLFLHVRSLLFFTVPIRDLISPNQLLLIAITNLHMNANIDFCNVGKVRWRLRWRPSHLVWFNPLFKWEKTGILIWKCFNAEISWLGKSLRTNAQWNQSLISSCLFLGI